MIDYLVYMLILAAAVGQALWNAMVKGSGDRLMMLASIRTVGLFGGAVLLSIAAGPAPESWPWLGAAAFVHYVYYAMMLNAYRLGDMGQVYPIARGLAPVLVLGLGILFAGERPNLWAFAAVLVLSSGIALLAFSGRRMGRRALLFALGTGVAISGYSYLSGIGIRKSGSILGYIGLLEVLAGSGLVGFALWRRRAGSLEFARAHWRRGLFAGILSVGGYSIALWAMARTHLASVVALRETSVVFAALAGSWLLREGFLMQRLLAASVVTVGIICLGISLR